MSEINSKAHLFNNIMFHDLFMQHQEVLEEMEKAKQEAAKKAAEPFVEKLKEIENQMIIIEKMILGGTTQ